MTFKIDKIQKMKECLGIVCPLYTKRTDQTGEQKNVCSVDSYQAIREIGDVCIAPDSIARLQADGYFDRSPYRYSPDIE